MKERLQKILSARGICSRRKAEEYLRLGLVKVNGKVAELGQKADPEVDRIEVDGKVLEERKKMLYYVMNKPAGVVTSNVPRSQVPGSMRRPHDLGTCEPGTRNDSPTVRDLLPKRLQGKIYPVGRLDKDSSGLLLFTNDGVLAYRLTHPKFDHEKEYEVQLDRSFPDRLLQKIAGGVPLKGGTERDPSRPPRHTEVRTRSEAEGEPRSARGGTSRSGPESPSGPRTAGRRCGEVYHTKLARCRRLSPNRFTIALTEGRHRQIRRMCQQYGYTVKSLRRVRIVTLTDRRLREGEIRQLTERERDLLLSHVVDQAVMVPTPGVRTGGER